MLPALDNSEWFTLSPLLEVPVSDAKARAAAQVGLMRLQQRAGASGIRTFGWTEVPEHMGIEGKNAHRRVSCWFKSGLWWVFWDALVALRGGRAIAEPVPEVVHADPVIALLDELHRAYRFFNWRFTGNTLPASIAITLERPQRRNMRMRGYYSLQDIGTPGGQKAHIALLPELLSSTQMTLSCLLHEMAHLRNWSLGIDDTDTRTQYHTLDFKVSAELFGLRCAKRDVSRGYASTELGDRAHHAIAALRPATVVFGFESPPD